jgi:acyl-CoA synthetase (AMP-forming)/AMP-acid ligase II
MSNPTGLLEILHAAPAERTAVILPEEGIRISYRQLRQQVSQMANDLAAMGIGRGDRVATVLPNGLPAIVSFLAAATAGTVAPLNPGYRTEEFSFYLADTGARL